MQMMPTSTIRLFPVSAAAVLIGGCISVHSLPASTPAAEIYAAVESSSGGTTQRSVSVQVFKDTQCSAHEYGTRAGSSDSFSNQAVLKSTPHRVPAEQPLVFSATYIDARMAQNRTCTVTASFTPQKSHRYKALLHLGEAVRRCQLSLFDVTTAAATPVEVLLPPLACAAGSATPRLNGQAVWMNW